MTAGQSSDTPIVTVEGVRYIIKVGGAKWSSAQSQYAEWHVVAFACDFGAQNVPLAGPFGTKSEAAKALKSYLDDAAAQAAIREMIRAAKARG